MSARRFLTYCFIGMASVMTGLAGCSSDESGLGSTSSSSITGVPQTVDVGGLGSGLSFQTLYAGQTIQAGTVGYDDIDTNGDGEVDALSICYRTQNGWELVETHFFIGATLAEMPATRSGNPQVGLFPYTSGNITGQTEYCFTIPFSALGFSCPGPEDYLVAAHAAVRKLLPGGGYQSETGWGNGVRLVQRGNWAMHNTIYITCDEANPPPVATTCETAFALGGTYASCFAEYPEYLDNPNRWGWTNGPLEEGNYSFEIWAAAGQCDLSKGTRVGTLTVSYAAGTAVVTYTISGTDPDTYEPYTLEEAHLYVGADPFATVSRGAQAGQFTLAPGQYPYLSGELADGTTTWTQTVTGLSGSIYVVAHGVVCGFPVE